MLEVAGLETFYGASQALFGVDLAVGEGQMVALLGRNGMGKTTTIRSICGLTPAKRGSVTFQGREIHRLPAFRVARLGLGLVPEGRRCFPNLTVRENLVATARGKGWDLAAVTALFPRLGERAGQIARTLSGGEQQMLAIGRALMARPRLLLLDEPSMGLAPVLVEQIFETVETINRQGVTILLVEQNAAMALSIAGRGYVLETGEIVLAGQARSLAEDPEVRRAYLGEE